MLFRSVPGLVQKLGLPMDAKFDKNTQDTIQDLLVRGNIAILKSGSVPITPENVYMAQMLGPSGAVWVNQALRAGQGDKLVADVLAERSGARDKEDYKGRLLKHNPQLVGVRAKDLAPKLASSLVNRGGLSQSLIGKKHLSNQLKYIGSSLYGFNSSHVMFLCSILCVVLHIIII